MTYSSLKREAVTVASIGLTGILALGLSQPRWLVGAVAVWSYCVWLLWHGLPDNHALPGSDPTDLEGCEPLHDGLGWPSLLTLLRGMLVAIAAGFVLLPMPSGVLAFVPAGAYTLASILDHLDGRLARALGRATRLGETLDMELDAVGILAASLLAILYEKIPSWYLAVGLARYVFVAGLYWRRRHGAPVLELDPSALRRWLAGLQMGFLSVALWPPVSAETTLFVAPFFGGLTLAMFARDWWYVSGRNPRTA